MLPEWAGFPVVSCALTLMLYVPGSASLGMFIVAVRFTCPPLETVMGFDGASEHIAPGRAEPSQLALIFPEYENNEVSVSFAVVCAPGAADTLCVPEME